MKEKTNKQFLAIILMLFCSVCLSISPLIWKLMPGYNLIYLTGGFILLFVGAFLMIFAFRFGELSVLQPINSMSYVFSTILAVLILHENIPKINFIGITLIIGGVIVIGISSK